MINMSDLYFSCKIKCEMTKFSCESLFTCLQLFTLLDANHDFALLTPIVCCCCFLFLLLLLLFLGGGGVVGESVIFYRQ